MLLIGLGLLPRLALRLRLSLLYLPFLRGLRLGDRGEIERLGLEGDLEIDLPFEATEYGERVRTRPREGDLDLDDMLATLLNGAGVEGSCRV